jgi:hypothetical protein
MRSKDRLPFRPWCSYALFTSSCPVHLPNTLFHRYNTRLNVYGTNPKTKIFQIDKTDQYVRIGDHSNNVGTVLVGGESVSLSSTQNLEIRTGVSQKTSYFENYNSGVNQGIRFNRNLTTTKDSDRITIPYGIDLTNLESKFASLEDKTNGLTIENN